MADSGVTVSELDSVIQSLERTLKAREEFADRAQRFCFRLRPADFGQPGMLAKVREFVILANECKRQDVSIALAMARCASVIDLSKMSAPVRSVN